MQQKEPTDLPKVLDDLKAGKRIVGPAPLWIYHPTENLRTDYMFGAGKKILGPSYSPLPFVVRFRPDYMLLTDESFRMLTADAKRAKSKIHVVDTGRECRLFGAAYKVSVIQSTE